MSALLSLHDLVVGHTTVLAHQGGWDEILMVAAPVGVFAVLLYVANKRAKRLAEQGTEGDDGTDPTPRPPRPVPRNPRAGPS